MPAMASAAVYAYTDAQGRIRITDIPNQDGRVIVLPKVGVDAPAAAAPARRTAAPRSVPSSGGAAVRRNPTDYREWVSEAAKTHRLSESLLFAVMKAESNFNPTAVSRAGAQGLMQLIPSTARHMGVSNAFDPRENIHGGAKYLRMMLDRFGRIDLALAAYNAGPEAVARYGGIPPYSETLNYVPRVLRFYRDYGGSGELALASVSRSVAPPRIGGGASRGSSAPAPRATSRVGDAPVITRTAAPIFYYRGPDGQIYISNVR
jgi:soluble lytic murein transglycosylase-like protein